jgi:predicted  nucleic acid-binding Zn-ribbon protein
MSSCVSNANSLATPRDIRHEQQQQQQQELQNLQQQLEMLRKQAVEQRDELQQMESELKLVQARLEEEREGARVQIEGLVDALREREEEMARERVVVEEMVAALGAQVNRLDGKRASIVLEACEHSAPAEHGGGGASGPSSFAKPIREHAGLASKLKIVQGELQQQEDAMVRVRAEQEQTQRRLALLTQELDTAKQRQAPFERECQDLRQVCQVKGGARRGDRQGMRGEGPRISGQVKGYGVCGNGWRAGLVDANQARD